MILVLLAGCPSATPTPAPSTPATVPRTPTPTGGTADTAPPQPPTPVQGRNILLFLIDDLSVDRLATFGLDGAHDPTTPVIDALADQGRVFRRAYTHPICSPTRAALLTGRHAYRTGVGSAIFDGDQSQLAQDELTLPEHLRAHDDWSTGAFGKWHLTSLDMDGVATHPNDQGFQEFDGVMKNVSSYQLWTRTHNGVATLSNTYLTRAHVLRASAWIAAAPEPWFAYVPLQAAHEPLHTPPAAWRYTTPITEPTDTQKLDLMVESIDLAIGRILDAIEPEVLERTWIVVMGDNGTTQRASVPPNDPKHSKITLYEGGVRVPLIIAGPGIEPGVTEALASVTDLFPTLLELTGTPLPDDRVIDGVSLVPVLQEPSEKVREWVYLEAFLPNLDMEGPRLHQSTLIKDDYKVLRDEHGAEELFRLQSDRLLGELVTEPNPTDQTAHERLAEQLDRITEDRLALWEDAP